MITEIDPYCDLYLSIDFLVMSIDHVMTLIIGIGPSLYSINYLDLEIQSVVFCKISNYLFQMSLMISRWFMAFACIDRYALTSETVRLRNFAKPKVAYRVIFLIIFIWSIICSHRLIFYQIANNICGIVNSFAAALYHSIYVIIGGGILPTTIMIISAWSIRRNLAHRQQRRLQLASAQPKENPLDRQLLQILFIQIICYIIIIIPQLSNLLFNTISLTIANRSKERVAVEHFVAFLAELILYLFPVTSFYLYTLTSRTFRNELKKFFSALPFPCCHHRIEPTTGSIIVDNSVGKQAAPCTVIADQTID